ncbi:NAD(P)/FAD-dependent oxidoreductase [Paraperlucidibaca wandonensis]|uniref:NAD(P)/FAD-dependent oxidoreductase n=1 Tax=Paraperlucidibaca wandonensis TaxID=1268273 RepID=A0ABW3HC64_9GAMM
MTARRLLIIGNGMAATRLLDELLARGMSGSDIAVVGEEDAHGYNRIALSPWLAGEKSLEQLITHDAEWYAAHDIALYLADPVVSVAIAKREVCLASGRVLAWQQLVFATGSRATRLSIPGHDLAGVNVFRSLADAEAIAATAVAGQRAVVIGGGLLGLEAAWGLRQRGLEVSVVHNGEWLMNRQLDAEAGALLAQALNARGIALHFGARSEAFVGDGELAGLRLRLSAGQEQILPCELAIMSLGITPEMSLAISAGLRCARAICVDAWLRSSAENVFALGECCEIDGESFGLVAPIYQQAKILADTLIGVCNLGYRRIASPTRLKVTGIDLFSAGELHDLADCKSIAWRDTQRGHYRRLWFRHHQLIAAVLFGDVDDGGAFFDVIEQGLPVADPVALMLTGSAA